MYDRCAVSLTVAVLPNIKLGHETNCSMVIDRNKAR